MKIVVLGNGYGGAVVAEFLQEELVITEVTSIDIRAHFSERHSSEERLIMAIRKSIQPYLGKVSLFVLSYFGIARILNRLRECYPYERFVSMSLDHRRIRFFKETNLLVLAKPYLLSSSYGQRLRAYLSSATIEAPRLEKWDKLIDHHALSQRAIYGSLGKHIYQAKDPSPYNNLNPKSSHAPPLRDKLPMHIIIQLARLAAKSSAATEARQLEIRSPVCEQPGFANEIPNETFQADAILVLDTHLWMIEPILRKIAGKRLPILDFREKLLHDVCLALRLRGVDGKLGE